MNSSEEQPLENTVLLPEVVEQIETILQENQQQNQTTHCFFCNQAFSDLPEIKLLCGCRFHTRCFLGSCLTFDNDDAIELPPGDVELHTVNRCPQCISPLFNFLFTYEHDTDDENEHTVQVEPEVTLSPDLVRRNERIIRMRVRREERMNRQNTILEALKRNKKQKKDLLILKRSIRDLRKNYTAYSKKKKELVREFQTEIEPLKIMIQQIQTKYLSQLKLLDELKNWKSSCGRVMYYKRKFIRDYEIEDFYALSKIKQLHLPSRWALFKLLNDGRYWIRGRRQFGCRI